MNQMSFDFDAIVPAQRIPTPGELWAEACAKEQDDAARNRAYRAMSIARAREYWRIGMATSLPIFSTVLDSAQRYTQMLPGVVEAIDGDTASVRIYAAPEYGYTLSNYPLHKKLAVEVPLDQLGEHPNKDLVRIAAAGLLETGDPEVAARLAGWVHPWGSA